ncbi:transcriptional regulator [Arenicella xantha]|uniref:OmpR/PhoB-type domain-containing protein n=1 Tax=Arenicella xantha TaxID=644221 RepID=A0A395JGU2_9GAMM|nr:transcriptional regulator [Arenicella xantha]RBP49126.1 hypothetical protein DFR28_10452 [Arenicella xantha]
MREDTNLRQRRGAIEHQRDQFDAQAALPKPHAVSNEILQSWKRSAQAVNGSPACAPRDEHWVTTELWKESPLSIAAKKEQSNMEQLVKEGQLVAAIADPCGRLLWTCASGYMSKLAENLNFISGGHWSEREVGTNAVGLSLKLKRAVTVFSSEHYSPYIQDWVCYAAPIIHPVSGECMGALDISTTWNKHTALGQSATTQLAHSIAQCLPAVDNRADLEIYAMGQPRVLLHGKALCLPPRQIEILCLLALNPDGLSLQQLHMRLYGDAAVSTSTLKADVSHLRRYLDGEIGSRPYRLTLPVWADFIHIWQALNEQRINDAMAMYRGSLLTKSDSPEIEEWRYCIDAVMAQTVHACDSPIQLVKQISQNTSSSLLERERLIELLMQQGSKT